MKPADTGDGLRLLRPAVWPLIWAHALTGFIVALGPGATEIGLPMWLQGIVGCGIWSVLLAAPGIGLTALLDPDAAARRRGGLWTAWIALAMVLLGLVASLVIGWGFFEAYLVGVILLVLYTAWPVRLARIPGIGIFMEGLGLAVLTFLAGFVSAGFILPTPKALMFAVGFLILYLLMRGVLFSEGRLSAPWICFAGAAAGFAGLALPNALDGMPWRAALPLLALPLWIGAGLRRVGGLGVTPLAVPTGLGVWLATDLAVICSALLR